MRCLKQLTRWLPINSAKIFNTALLGTNEADGVLTENTSNTPDQQNANPVIDRNVDPYDGRRLSYANTFTNPWKVTTIRVLEWLTGKALLLFKIRKFEKSGVPFGHPFFTKGLKAMGIEILTPQEQRDQIPKTGPLIVVANHPGGLVDGLIAAELIGQVRTDYKILTRSLLTGVAEIEHFMLPVAFPHEEDSNRKNLNMRKEAMKHLKDDGVIILFPAGQVAASETWFGEAIEAEWNPFTAKMIERSGATVLPIYFPGQNSRAYQIANQVSATLRQGLLLHEIKYALNKPQKPVIGQPLSQDDLKEHYSNSRGFMTWLRQKVLDLREK
ncbi:lysophospholipid acyltransferase family protein [Rhodobacteraceae bacterium MYP1-1]|uniref:Lysophospholipid acyltransferase family protein n=1 Tax=Halocynthiibacter styelae TaxID=2761955 RepID=A0A8J7J429_9RHOB|nr:lysophospholipid acyltransferase family protein [Paenihalocynthiibacter styelae]